MNPCPQCGAAPQPTDKFCNICGTPVVAPAPQGFGAPPQQGGFGAPPPQAGFGAPAYGAPPAQGSGAPLRCQMGHDIAPGLSYCAHGHPLALDAMPFGNDQYGGGYPQGPQPGGFGQPQPQQPPYGGGFGAPAPQQAYGDPQQGYGAPYADPNAQFGGGFGQQPNGFAPQPPAPYGGAGGYAPPPQPAGFGGAQPGFPPPPQQQPGGFPGAAPAQDPAAPAPAPNLPPTALRGFLVSYQSNTQGDFWPLSGGRKTVGRANSGENVDIPLSDATISSRHAAFVVDGVAGTVEIEDTGSTNGTFVNEEHIGFNGKRELRDGDKVRFGGYTTIAKIIGHL